MKATFEKLSPFHVDSEEIMKTFGIQDGDFRKASNEEKEAMVETHKSVSFWRDALRRFRSNVVSMVALCIFIVCLFFAFLGPALIPYNYEDQYRNSLDLSPMKYSEAEQEVRAVQDRFDAFYSSVLRDSVRKGNYYIEYKGKTYAFTIEKGQNLGDCIIALDLSREDPLFVVKMKDVADGDFTESTPLEYTSTPGERAKKLEVWTSVFPHVFGTDSSGRDIMARTMYGARVSIIIGIVAALIVLIIGSIYGSVSGLCGGKVDFVMMRIVEIIYSIPEVLIVLLLQVVLKDPLRDWFDKHSQTSAVVKAMSDLGPGIISIFITFAVLYWVTMARIIRGQVLQIKKQEFVTAATALGASNSRIIRKHLLPNCVGPLVITTCLQIPSAIFLESFLSFLGLGVSAPMASLGSLCSDALGTIELYPYRLVFPAVVLTIIVLTLNLVGDGLRDALDPRLKK